MKDKTRVKALVLYSGGLDSRLAVKLLQEQGLEVEALFFKLPFGGGCCNDEMCNFKFTQIQNAKLHIIDVTKNPFLTKYLNIIKKPKFGYGSGLNPCIDCRIFLLKEAKKIADKQGIKIIATGEVLGERPMSQTAKALKIIDKEAGFEITRPLIEIGIHGRSRKKQIELAKKFKINYPSPGGGCLLCEKELVKRIKLLLNKNLITQETLPLVKLGRHFFIDENQKNWFVVGRNEQENKIIEKYKNSIKSGKGKPAVYYYKKTAETKEIALEMQKSYSKSDNESLKKKFEKYKL